MPWTPPVHGSSGVDFSSCGIAMASAKVASARYKPSRRKAGKPKRNPTMKQAGPAAGSVQ